MGTGLYNVLFIDQNGRKIPKYEDVRQYEASKICRENNRLLKTDNPHKIRKWIFEEAEEGTET